MSRNSFIHIGTFLVMSLDLLVCGRKVNLSWEPAVGLTKAWDVIAHILGGFDVPKAGLNPS